MFPRSGATTSVIQRLQGPPNVRAPLPPPVFNQGGVIRLYNIH